MLLIPYLSGKFSFSQEKSKRTQNVALKRIQENWESGFQIPEFLIFLSVSTRH